MKTATETRAARCANEGCPRPAEAGERFCSTCSLERDLFQRDARRPGPEIRTAPGTPADRR
jgi:hypothetical protein